MTDHTVLVSGSHGDLVVDRRLGHIVEAFLDEGDDDYANIAWFDPTPFAAEPERGHFDILACAYTTTDVWYEPALTIRTREDDDFDDWVPLALLPAPARSVSQ